MILEHAPGAKPHMCIGLLGLSRALFPTTFLEIAVFTLGSISNQKFEYLFVAYSSPII